MSKKVLIKKEAVDKIIDLFSKTKNNDEFVDDMIKKRWF